MEEGEGFAGGGGGEFALQDFEDEWGAGFPEDAVFVFGEGASDACGEERGDAGAEGEPGIVVEIVRGAARRRRFGVLDEAMADVVGFADASKNGDGHQGKDEGAGHDGDKDRGGVEKHGRMLFEMFPEV